MVVVIEGVAGPAFKEPAKGVRLREVKIYAYMREETSAETGGDRVADANHAVQIIDRLECDVITKGEPPRGDGYRPLWRVELQVLNVHRRTAGYRAAYHKEDGCPANQIELMMTVYAAMKRIMRNARDDRRARKASGGCRLCGRRPKCSCR